MGQTSETTDHTSLALTPQQRYFFDTFGFLHLPNFLGDDLEEITEAFEQVFVHHQAVETFEDIHFGGRRIAIPFFLEGHPRLKQLETDPRILAVVTSILGERYEYRQTDGNLLFCDTAWHCDIYDSPLDQFHIKLFFYLDPLERETGGLRVIPGSNDYVSRFATRLREDFDPWPEIERLYGVPPEDIPSWPIDNQPGDLIVGNYRTIHATFGGAPRRRLFTMNYRELRAPS
jgi:hypothetical protein